MCGGSAMGDRRAEGLVRAASPSLGGGGRRNQCRREQRDRYRPSVPGHARHQMALLPETAQARQGSAAIIPLQWGKSSSSTAPTVDRAPAARRDGGADGVKRLPWFLAAVGSRAASTRWVLCAPSISW